jgi:hypothetical protein
MNNSDKSSVSAEYKAGYDKGYGHGFRWATILLMLVGFLPIVFGG